MMMPPFRNASSRSRCASVSKLKTVVSKISASGLNVTFVPRRLVVPVTSSAPVGCPALVALLIGLAVAPDLEIERLRQRVDDGDADAVQAAGHLVAVVVELAAGVKHGQDDFRRPTCRCRVRSTGMPRPLSTTVTGAVDVDGDVDLIAEAGQRLVDRVVDDFVDQVVEAGWHPWTRCTSPGRLRTASSPSRTLILSAQ